MLENLPLKTKANAFISKWGISLLAVLGGGAMVLLGAELLGCLAAGIGIGWGLKTWRVQRTLTQPLEQLTALGEATLVQDSLAFTDALVALAQGDLTARVKLSSQPVSLSGARELKHLKDLFNRINTSLQESAHQFNAVTDEPCQRLFYVGSDAYLEGRTCGEIMGQALGGQGDVVIILGFATQASQEIRRKGFESLLREKYAGIHILDRLESQGKADVAYAMTKDWLARGKIPHGIYITDGGVPAGVARAVVEASLAGKVKLVSHDLVNETMQYVSKGVIHATLGQDPFAQGHDTVVHLFNYLVSGWRPATPRLLTAPQVVTAENYRQFWKAGEGTIESQANQERRAKPIRPSPRPLRIAVVGREESDFWMPVKAGALAAAQTLRAYNASVDWVVPEADQAFDIDIRGPYLEKLVEQGYQAIALDIPQQRLVPYINRAAARGISVATFNGEPSSLRALISLLDNRAKVLLSVSQDLADSAQHLGGSQQPNPLAKTDQETPAEDNIVHAITMAVREVGREAQEQTRAASQVSAAVDEIVRAIDEVALRINDVSELATISAETARKGTDTVNQTLQQMQRIHDAVGVTAQTVQEMNTYSQQIGKILGALDELTNQTNLLALNASIVGAAASEAGQGFSVVAKEMRVLANQSRQATMEVDVIVQSVQKSIGVATESMLATIDLVKDSSTLASLSGEALQQLLASAVTMEQHTVPLVGTNEIARNASINLRKANQQVSGVIAENLAATRQISATTDKLVSQTQAVSGSASELAEIARELEGATAMFKIE